MRYFADYIKGKPYQKTVLWENSSPTSDFSAQTITLSDDITNYDMLEVVWLRSKNATDKNTIQFSVADIINNGNASGVAKCRICIGEYDGSLNTARLVYYVSNTQLGISVDYRFGASTTYTDSDIPLKIIGIKKGINEFKFKKGTLTWSEFTETGASGEHKIEVGFRPKKIIWYFPNTCFLDTYYEEVSTTYFVGNTLITSGNYSWQKLGLKAGQNPWLLNLQSVDDIGFTLGYKDYQDWSSRTLFWEAWG